MGSYEKLVYVGFKWKKANFFRTLKMNLKKDLYEKNSIKISKIFHFFKHFFVICVNENYGFI